MENFPTDSQVHGYSLRRLVFLFLLLLIAVPSISQSLSTESKKAKKLYEKADKKYRERDFLSALELLEQSVIEDPRFFEAHIRMGSLYSALGKVDSVYSKFKTYVAIAPDPIASVLEKVANMSFDRGHYIESKRYIEQFLAKVPEKANSDDVLLLRKSIEFAESQLANGRSEMKVVELPVNVNRFPLQYLPSVTVDNASMFYTKRDHVNGDEDIVVSNKVNGEWSPAISVSKRINSSFNEGACTVSADGRTMIFTSCDGRNSMGSCDLYITKKVGNEWGFPKNLGKPINTIYWESQPTLSADGNTLYFSSNRRGGYGGRDIWVSKNINGEWTNPTNLGSTINSAREETTPFIHANGLSLYFSANGYPGMGGYDLYTSEKTDSTWTKPKNLGYPINTHKDEVAIVISSDGVIAYFAKEEQKSFEILDSKIVSIKLSESVRAKPSSYIVGNVLDSNTKIPISSKIEVVNLSNGEAIYSSKSDSLTGKYYMVLPSGLDLAAYIKKKGYLFSEFHFKTDSVNPLEPDTINIELNPIETGSILVLENIYFNVNSYELNEKSITEIKNIYQLLNENPNIKVEIAGHTDNTGSQDFNRTLSKMRAKEVYNRLIQKGILSVRLSYKGYSDTKPVSSNQTERGRESNRRIEFRVLRGKH